MINNKNQWSLKEQPLLVRMMSLEWSCRLLYICGRQNSVETETCMNGDDRAECTHSCGVGNSRERESALSPSCLEVLKEWLWSTECSSSSACDTCCWSCTLTAGVLERCFLYWVHLGILTSPCEWEGSVILHLVKVMQWLKAGYTCEKYSGRKAALL